MQNGFAGFLGGSYPQVSAIVYDPELPAGTRFTAVAARTNIMRP